MYVGNAIVKASHDVAEGRTSPDFKSELKRKLILRIKAWLFDNGYSKEDEFIIVARPVNPTMEVIYDSTKHS